MKAKRYLFIAMIAFGITACTSDNDDLGDDLDLNSTSLIPQGKASADVDGRIVALYGKYGTYFLYDFTPDEAIWAIVGGSSNYSSYTLKPADLNYIGDALDLLEGTFLNIHEQDFLKKMLPLKVFLADSIKTAWSTNNILATGTSFIIGNMGKAATAMTTDQKYTYSKSLNDAFISYLVTSGKVKVPDGFYQVSDYSVSVNSGAAYGSEVTPYRVMQPSEAALNAGFFTTMQSWMPESQKKESDALYYLQFMLYIPADSEEWTRLLSYPLVKQKYDILRNAMKSQYGFDPQHPHRIIIE